MEVGLLTFRVGVRVDGGVSGFEAERLADHRVAYLEYEGEISGGRGSVRRVAEGVVENLQESENRIEVRGVMGGVRVDFVGRPVGAGVWRFETDRR
jgi:hypothetical protein